MTSPTHDAYRTIERCRRDGRVLWQHVAQQMGMSVDSVRSQYDPGYRQAKEGIAGERATPVVIRPPTIRRPPSIGPLARRILAQLRDGPKDARAIIAATGVTANTAYGRLSDLVCAGLVERNDDLPRVWRLVEQPKFEEAA